MHVLFDARLLHRPMSGLERVQTNLLRELASRAEISRLRVVVTAGTRLPKSFPAGADVVEVDSTEGILRVLLTEPRPDIYHLTYFPDRSPRDLLLPLASRASVVEVHDAILNRHPEYHPDHASWAWYHSFVRALLRCCDRILVHSQSVAKEAVRDLGAREDLIEVAPLAVDPTLATPLPQSELAARLAKLDVHGEYFLAVGKDYPHKDHATLFRALGRLPRPVQVVCAGSKVWHRRGETTDELLRALGIEDRVRWLQGLHDEDIKALLQGARALVYPSREEGFGLPPLEAMALGTPAIVSRAMSMPGVCGDGAFFFEPGDDAALAALMQQVLRGGAPIDAQIARGRARAASFSWSRTADFTIQCYLDAIAAARANQRARPQLGPALEEAVRVMATSPFGDRQELHAWQQRCRDAELHARNVEDNRDDILDQLNELQRELGRRETPAPLIVPPEVPLLTVGAAENHRPRWSFRRRWGKIKERWKRRFAR